MSLDNNLSFGSFSLPPLGDANFSLTPQRSGSRRSSRRAMTPPSSSSPAPRAHDDENEAIDGLHDKISPLDPRRFTPTLHANLVSEILNLRREVESKNKQLLDLEENLSTANDDNKKLSHSLEQRDKERSKMRREIQELEGGTMSALDKLAKERDESNDLLADVRKRLDESQKLVKRKDKEINDTNDLWAKDQDQWATERRKLNHKVHVVESRLKTVLSEVEAGHVNGELVDRPQSRTGDRPLSRTSDRAVSRASGARSSLSHRRGSSVSTADGAIKKARLSHISEVDGPDNAATLADELQFDDEFDDEEYEVDEPVSPKALPEEQQLSQVRSFSAQSHRQSIKARKVLGLDIGDDEADETNRELLQDAVDLQLDEIDNELLDSWQPTSRYTDSATQFSPPASPVLHPQQALSIIEEAEDERSIIDSRSEVTVNDVVGSDLQKQKRWSGGEPVSMVSSACQTVEQLPSPPYTPVESKQASFDVSNLPAATEMCDSSTQTLTDSNTPTLAEFAAGSRNETSPRLEVPTISIRPPTRAETRRNSVVLPPQTKNAACQAYITVPVTSTSVQTEEIRIDRRPVKLPTHLLPSSVSSNPSSPTESTYQSRPANEEDDDESKAKLKAPALPNRSTKRISARVKELSSKFTQGEVENEKEVLARAKPKESARASSSRELLDVDLSDGNVSEDSYLTKPQTVKKTLSKVQNSWKLVNQHSDVDDDRVEAASEGGTTTTVGHTVQTSIKSQSSAAAPTAGQKSEKKEGKTKKTVTPINTDKSNEIRKAAMITSGNAAQGQIHRARSPSAPPAPGSNLTGQMPYPVPTRSSSRNIPWGSSDGTGSPTPQTVSFFGIDQQAKQKRPPTKKPVLRKIRSANHEFYKLPRSRSRSPPPSTSSFPESPALPQHPPPLPNDDINSPFRPAFKPGHQSNKASVASAADSVVSEQTSVVDSIAQTMIGEWMWKYVRKRSTFGRNEVEFDARSNNGNGVRHQRWVWLAPYERAVLWSSKQPTSGPALMGKSGRKLQIQSVLDVRDDTQAPKGNTTCFGRSILILTPQRALKFTAINRERHYVWLKALSFLSSSSVVPSELGGPSPSAPSASSAHRPPSSNGPPASSRLSQATSAGAPPPLPPASLRRHPIRDSIRIAKGKSRPVLSAGGRRAYTDPSKTSIPNYHHYHHNDATHHNNPHSHLDNPNGYYFPVEDDSDDAAEAPSIPRTHSHTRRRSNTGPKYAGSSGFRSISSSTKPSLPSLHNGSSRGTATQSFRSTDDNSTAHGWQTDSGSYGGAAKRKAEWVHEPMPETPQGFGNNANGAVNGNGMASGGGAVVNFFDAMGGVSRLDGVSRMEAFVKGKKRDLGLGGPLSAPLVGNGNVNGSVIRKASVNGLSDGVKSGGEAPERKSYRNRQGRKKDVGKYWGAPDPFEGF